MEEDETKKDEMIRNLKSLKMFIEKQILYLEEGSTTGSWDYSTGMPYSKVSTEKMKKPRYYNIDAFGDTTDIHYTMELIFRNIKSEDKNLEFELQHNAIDEIHDKMKKDGFIDYEDVEKIIKKYKRKKRKK